jgi:hypothetical protein
MSTSRMSAIALRMTALENTLTTRFDLIMARVVDLDRISPTWHVTQKTLATA